MPIDISFQMIRQRLFTHTAFAISIAVHTAIAFGLAYANARMFEGTVSEAIPVSLVTPEEVQPAATEIKPPPPPDVSKPDLRSRLHDQAVPQPKMPQPLRKNEPAATRAPAPSPPAAAAPQSYASPPPDLSLKYQVDLGLKAMAAAATSQASSGKSDFDDAAVTKSAIDTASVAAFRKRLRECAALPPSVEMTDKVVIVLRATFLPDGHLANAPQLIEASASSKGPALMNAALSALQTCQPHTALPADKYAEWQRLDLRFTPNDFRR